MGLDLRQHIYSSVYCLVLYLPIKSGEHEDNMPVSSRPEFSSTLRLPELPLWYPTVYSSGRCVYLRYMTGFSYVTCNQFGHPRQVLIFLDFFSQLKSYGVTSIPLVGPNISVVTPEIIYQEKYSGGESYLSLLLLWILFLSFGPCSPCFPHVHFWFLALCMVPCYLILFSLCTCFTFP